MQRLKNSGVSESVDLGELCKQEAELVSPRLLAGNTHSVKPIDVATAHEWINNSLLDDTTDAKVFLHFNSVWFCMNGVSDLQKFCVVQLQSVQTKYH